MREKQGLFRELPFSDESPSEFCVTPAIVKVFLSYGLLIGLIAKPEQMDKSIESLAYDVRI